MNKQTKLPLTRFVLSLIFLGGAPASAQIITLSLSAYNSSNYLSDGVTVVPNSTVMKLGYFYSGSSFIGASSAFSTWTNTLASSASISAALDNFDNNFYTLKADNGTMLQTTAGDFASGQGKFWISLDPNGNESEAKFASVFTVNPASFSPTLTGVSTIGVKPFVWVETADRSQFGLFEANTAMPNGNFPNLSIDLVIGTTGFTPLVGTLSANSFTLIPEPSTSALLLVGLVALCHRRRTNKI